MGRSGSAPRSGSAVRPGTRDYVDRGEFTDLVELITPIIFPDAKKPTKKDLKMAFIQVRNMRHKAHHAQRDIKARDKRIRNDSTFYSLGIL